MMRLSTKDRIVLSLRHFSECSYQEIGQILDLDEKTVKSRLFEARHRLRDMLKGFGRNEHENHATHGIDARGPRQRSDVRGSRKLERQLAADPARALNSTSSSGCSTTFAACPRRIRRRASSLGDGFSFATNAVETASANLSRLV
jgi:hypothetical protein